MAFEYGGRFNTGDYFSTKIDIDNETAETQGTIDGIPIEFSGSSDFSTAEVTISNGSDTLFEIPAIDDDGEVGMAVSEQVSNGFDATVSAILYKGLLMVEPTNVDGTVVTTGDITWDDLNGHFRITGNGTITIS